MSAVPTLDRPRAGSAMLHLFTVSRRRVPQALGHMASDKFRVKGAPGLRFVKLLGTSSGTTFMPHDADLGLWGIFTVWDTKSDALRFHEFHSVLRSWRSIADHEAWFDLQPIRWKGSWSGHQPFGQPTVSGADDSPPGPIAVVTRARIRPRKLLSFLRSVPPVAADAQAVSGSLLRIGIGEAPIGLQATFSIWSDSETLNDFAYRREAHRNVVRKTVQEGWYAEELFVRFALKSATGTVRGASMDRISQLLPATATRLDRT